MAIPLGAPRGSCPHPQFPLFTSPVAPSFFSPFYAPHPHGPATCVLVVVPSTLIASQQDGAGVSRGVHTERRRETATAGCGICPQSAESANKPNFHTVHMNNPWSPYAKKCLPLFTIPARAQKEVGRGVEHSQPPPF